MIHEGDIDLDPEYQRGRYCTLIQSLIFCSIVLIFLLCRRSCSMVGFKADGYHRFTLSQLLRPTCRICNRKSRRLRDETMRRWKTAPYEYTKVL